MATHLKSEARFQLLPSSSSRIARAVRFSVFMGLAVSLAACVSVVVPVNEYNIARAAMEAAEEAEAARFAPALWYKAELAYREGTQLFRDRDYKAAQIRFEAARTFAEQAENSARLGRAEEGAP